MRTFRTIGAVEEACLRDHTEAVDYIMVLFDEYRGQWSCGS